MIKTQGIGVLEVLLHKSRVCHLGVYVQTEVKAAASQLKQTVATAFWKEQVALPGLVVVFIKR